MNNQDVFQNILKYIVANEACVMKDSSKNILLNKLQNLFVSLSTTSSTKLFMSLPPSFAISSSPPSAASFIILL